jgi:hypothetical protein
MSHHEIILILDSSLEFAFKIIPAMFLVWLAFQVVKE